MKENSKFLTLICQEKDEFISTHVVLFCERVSFMYFPVSLRMIQLTFLFHDELKRAMGGLKEITVDSDIDFFTPKDCHRRSNWKKICLTDEAIRNTIEKM